MIAAIMMQIYGEFSCRGAKVAKKSVFHQNRKKTLIYTSIYIYLLQHTYTLQQQKQSESTTKSTSDYRAAVSVSFSILQIC